MTIEPKLVTTDLSVEKRDLLSYLLKEEGIEPSLSNIIPRRENPDKAPLSFAQERLWFLDQMESDSAAYNIPAAFRLAGPLNIPALEQSINEIVRRHAILRTTFAIADGQPVQVIAPSLAITLIVKDLRLFSEVAREVEVERLTAKEARCPFNLTRGPLLRATLLQLGDEEHVLLLTIHHIVFDEWSFKVFNQELSTLYKAFSAGRPSPLPELLIQYTDFAQWLRGEALQVQLAYWKKQLGGSLPVLELPTDRLRPATQTFRGELYSFALPKRLSEAIKALSRRENVTLSMLLLAAFKVLLYRYTGQADIAVGFPITGRNRSELEGLIGFFLNTLVLRTDLSGNPSFRELLDRVRQVSLNAYTHRDLPFEKLVQELQPERDLSHTPLFQVMFVLQDAETETLSLPGLSAHQLETDSGTAKFDLTLFMKETRQGLQGIFEYNTDLFDAATIERMVRHLRMLLERSGTHPEWPVSELMQLTEAEQVQMGEEWNATQADYPRDKCVHELFEAQVERVPDAVAVTCDEEHVTYETLNRRANQLAHYLQETGVRPEVMVGICLERSIEMMVGLLGILKAGGAYVPLDPDYPQDRLGYMLQDVGMPIVLTRQRLRDRLPQHVGRAICLDAEWKDIAQPNQLSSNDKTDDNLAQQALPDNLLYVIYTSGSTGQPKGAGVVHTSFVNLLNWFVTEFGLTSEDRVLLISSLSFDLTQKNLYAPLIVGGTLLMRSSEYYDAAQLVQAIGEQHVSWVNCAPSAFYPLLEQGDASAGMKASLRYVFLGGEPISISRLWEWLQTSGGQIEIVNTYGPTECTDICAAYRVESAEQFLDRGVPIGRPIHNAKLYVLDQNLALAPVGVVGELHVGGTGVGRGYVNQLELNLTRFIPDPYSDEAGARLYKSGDLARYLADGNIEFLGRVDHQVKVRGFRIELGEIESVLRKHPAIQETIVLVRKAPSGGNCLVAYVVSNTQSESLDATLRDHLKRQLPSYMIPSAFVKLQALPLTPNGKVDRRELPAPDDVGTGLMKEYVAPRTPVEETLAGIWAEVLGLERVGIHDNFFDLGGHSLLATRIISRVCNAFQVELPLRYLFESPSVADLVEHIKVARQACQNIQAISLRPIPRDKELPVSFNQERKLLRKKAATRPWHAGGAFRLRGPLNRVALECSLGEIVRRHETLRTTFSVVQGRAVQVISPAHPFSLPVVDLQELGSEQEVCVRQWITTEAERPFDQSRDILLRATLFRLGSEEHILILWIDHIVSDSWSFNVFRNELSILYEAFSTGKIPQLPELSIQYADFANWQRQRLQGESLEEMTSYWNKHLGDRFPESKLPTDHPRPNVILISRPAHQEMPLPSSLSESLRLFASEEQVTLFMLLLAAFQTLLRGYINKDDISVLSAVANRTCPETEVLIGMFAHGTILRTNLAGDPSFRELLGRVREVVLGAYAHQELPYAKLVENLQPELSFNPVEPPMVYFSFESFPEEPLSLTGLSTSALEVDRESAFVDLTVLILEKAGELVVGVDYRAELFEATTISQMLTRFSTLLENIVANPQLQLSALLPI